MSCAAGSLGMSQSIWRHCLNRRSHTAWHNSSAGLQVSLTKSQALGNTTSVSARRLTVFPVFREPYHHPEESPALPVVS